MDTTILHCLSQIEFTEAQTFNNMTVLPILSQITGGPEYITLGEAIERGVLTIKEVNQGGSVPNLAVVNSSSIPILLLDGEEVIGAKQNRVLNTTVLLKEGSETVIPVSCTEHGRWQYTSDRFDDSDVVLASNIRSKKNRSVNQSLMQGRSYESNQSEVWNEISELHESAGVNSPTGAMKDSFNERAGDISEYLDAFSLVPEQRGLLVFINGKPVGFDYLSFDREYSRLHTKLLKSYAISALVRKKKTDLAPDASAAKAFIESLKTSSEHTYDSIGYGIDHRFEAAKSVGSALVYDDTVIHTAFFRTSSTKVSENMSSSQRRTGFRI